MKMIDRRAFLSSLAATPLVYGLPSVLCQETSDKTPWLAEALKRMAETGRWGVVLVPFENPDLRSAQASALYALTELDDEDYEAHDLFCQAVFIALPAAVAKAKFPKADGATRILLDPAGIPLTWDKAGLDEYASPANFAAFFRTFIHGADGARLEERAKAIEATLSEELKHAVSELGSESSDQKVSAVLALGRKIETITPYVAWLEQKAPTNAARLQARLLLRRYFTTLPRESIGKRLPYGTKMIGFKPVCSWYVPDTVEVTIACGQGHVSKRTGKFVSFLAQ